MAHNILLDENPPATMASPITETRLLESTPPPPILDASQPFEPDLILKLPGMTSDQLSQLEEVLSSEFQDLSRQYLHAREARINFMLLSIDRQIKKFQARDGEWTQKYNYEVDLIERLANNTENKILADRTGVASHSTHLDTEAFDREVDELMASLILPTALDDIFGDRQNELPFAPQFKRIIQQYQDQLQALSNQKQYQDHLVDENVRKYKSIVWKLYKRDASEYRAELIDQTYLELNQLYQEYHGLKDYRTAGVDADNYYRSLVLTNDMNVNDEPHQQRLSTQNIDGYYDVDNRYSKNNRVQITDAKLTALGNLKQFQDHQRMYTIPQVEDAQVRLSGLQGLTQDETESDLQLLRVHVKQRPESTVTQPVKEEESVSEFKAVLDENRVPSRVEMEPLELSDIDLQD